MPGLGGFTLFTKRIADMIGFEDNRGNTLAVAKDGTLEGVVGEPILGREGKLATLLDLTARLGIGLKTRWRSATAPTISP